MLAATVALVILLLVGVTITSLTSRRLACSFETPSLSPAIAYGIAGLLTARDGAGPSPRRSRHYLRVTSSLPFFLVGGALFVGSIVVRFGDMC